MNEGHDQQRRGWTIVSVLFLSMAATIGSAQYAFGLFVAPIEETFGWSRTEISASLSFVAVGSLAAPFLGRIMDRYGARWVLVVSLLLAAFSFLLRPLMSELWHWYALSFIQFLGFVGATTLPTGRLIGIWFGKRSGRVMGVATVGPNFGGLMMPIMVASILSVASWQMAYMAIGGVLMAVALFGFLAVREHPLRMVADSDGGAKQSAPQLAGWEVSDALSASSFYLMTLALVAAFFTYGCILPHVVAHLMNEGFETSKAAFSLGTLAVAGMAGKLFFGFLSERISTRIAFVIDLVGHAACATALVMVDGGALVFVVPVYGFFMGGTGVMSVLIVQEFFGLKSFGAIAGLSNMASVVSFGVGPLLAGLSYDYTGSYDLSFLAVAGIFLVGALLLGMARASPPPVHVE